jgi:hypothetical protein
LRGVAVAGKFGSGLQRIGDTARQIPAGHLLVERFEVGGRRDEGENLHRKRDGQSGQTGQ